MLALQSSYYVHIYYMCIIKAPCNPLLSLIELIEGDSLSTASIYLT